MSALAEALLAAQRQGIATLERQYVAGTIEVEPFCEWLDAMGCRDALEQGQLLAALNALRQYGTALPATNGAPAPKEAKPASEAQWKLIRRLADERGQVAPEGPLTLEQASQVIEELRKASA